MTKKKQIDKILTTLSAIQGNLGLLKKSKIKKKYALETIYASIGFHLKIINKLILILWEEENGK